MDIVEATVAPAPVLESENNESDNYAAVRYNAMTHGVLSQLVVLPHEDKDAFHDLLSSLTLEHQPNGPTEGHLVEELAGIMWRKRRILLAEGAKVNKGLRSTLHYVHSSSSDTVKNAVPADLALVDSCVAAHGLMSMTREDCKLEEQEKVSELEVAEKAIQILCQNGSTAYEDALNTLTPDSQDWWKSILELDRADPTDEHLRDFIEEELLPNIQGNLAQIRHCEAIKRQVMGEGINVQAMGNLSRYETHLDRKFERTLAMLIKLKELRGKK